MEIWTPTAPCWTLGSTYFVTMFFCVHFSSPSLTKSWAPCRYLSLVLRSGSFAHL
jgi:hypothetical protein